METTERIVEDVVNRLQKLKAPSQSTDSEGNFITLVCTSCNSEAEAKRKGYPTGTRLTYECQDCATERRTVRFEAMCPALYRESDESRLPAAHLSQAMAWQWSSRGLLFIGDTGKGKSRIAWRLLRRVLIHDRPERHCLWFDCVGFGHAITEHYRKEDAETWLDTVAAVPLLFFDDLGKLKMTERAETELFGIIERRAANMLPVIATTNDSGDSLAARMTENRGPAFVRRLREFCDIVKF